MDERIKNKIEEIEEYLCELEEIIPEDLKKYQQDFKTKAACEHYFEKIIEACENLGFFVVKFLNLKFPEKDMSIFDSLLKENIINKELSQKLKEAKGMRNLISHEYGIVDDEIVFDSITSEIDKDIKYFLRNIREFLK